MSFLLVQYQQYPVGSLFLSHLPPIWWYIPITFRWARETKWQERMTWEWESSFIIRYQVTWSPDYFSFYYRPIAIVVFLCFATWDDNCLSTVPHQKLIYSVTVTSNGPILCSNTGWLTKKNSEQKRVKTTQISNINDSSVESSLLAEQRFALKKLRLILLPFTADQASKTDISSSHLTVCGNTNGAANCPLNIICYAVSDARRKRSWRLEKKTTKAMGPASSATLHCQR